MMPKWMGTGSGASDAASAGDDELRMIPRWSMVLAVCCLRHAVHLPRGDAAPQA